MDLGQDGSVVVWGCERLRDDSRRLDKHSQEKCGYHEDYGITAEDLTIATNEPLPPKTVTSSHIRRRISLPTSKSQKSFGCDLDNHNNTLVINRLVLMPGAFDAMSNLMSPKVKYDEQIACIPFRNCDKTLTIEPGSFG